MQHARNRLSGPDVSRCNSIRVFAVGTILLVILILLLVGVLPAWPYSSRWGYYPSGGLGLALAVIAVLLLLGRI